MTLRLLTTADFPALYALWTSCPGMGLNDRDDTPEGIARYLARNPLTCFGAEEDGMLIGCILAGHDGRRGYIYHTAVHPVHQRRGVGAALVQSALSALRAEGISKVALVAFRHNEAGNTFWEKQGFILREDLHYRNIALTDMNRIDT